MDPEQLRAADPARVLRAAEGLTRIRDGLKEAADGVRNTVHGPLAGGAWTGQASTAALAHIDRVGNELANTLARIERAGQEVRRFADALFDAKSMVARADDIADAARLTIGKDGSVTFPRFDPPLTEAEAQRLKAAGQEAHDLLNKALTTANDADAACAGALASATGAGEAAAVGSSRAHGGDSGGGDSLADQLGAMFDDPETDFDDSMLGTVMEQVREGDSIWEQLGFGTEGGGFDIGNMSPLEEEALGEILQLPEGTTVDDLLGEDVVDTISEEGVWAGVGEWWDQSWEDMANVPDRIGEGWDDFTEGVDNFVDDPIGTVGGWLS